MKDPDIFLDFSEFMPVFLEVSGKIIFEKILPQNQIISSLKAFFRDFTTFKPVKANFNRI